VDDHPARTTFDFSGRTAVITGGAGDIGRATARLLLASGASVALLDRDHGAVRRAASQLASASPTSAPALPVVCDVRSLEEVTAALERIHHNLGPIDLVFNNAGYQGVFVPVDRYPADDFRTVLDVNVLGVFHVLQAAVPRLRGRGSVIVNTASFAGVVGPPNMVAYAASKFAVVGLTQSAAKDLAPKGIRVNSVSPALIGPGVMWTRQIELQAQAGSPYFDSDPAVVEQQMLAGVPLARLGTLEEVAAAVAFLASDAASYITGFNLEVTGGQ
jgi:NAD(P)-dependent dehydrogenase (short-subunit alcohol dehydrogenase family)